MKILIIEEEQPLIDLLKTILRSNDFETEAVYDGKIGIELARLGIHDLLILDMTAPHINGLEIAHELRSNHYDMPILMLSDKSEVTNRIDSLNAGADYYLTKPFDTRELLACINALLRRQKDEINYLTYGNTTLDLACGTLICHDKKIRLSAKEFDVMRFLLRAKNHNLSKEILLARVWGYDSNAVENYVEVYVGFLRKKLAGIGSNIKIKAIRRLGYHLEVSNIHTENAK